MSDRQLLFANTGFRANLAPVATGAGTTQLTHTDLSTRIALDTIAHDNEGESVFWRVLGATHGSARLLGDGHPGSSPGQALLFTPEPGYTGPATITVQADDGFAASAPIKLSVNISGAQLVAIRLQPIPDLLPGQAVRLIARGDFEDQLGVDLTASPDYLVGPAKAP